MNDTSKNDSLLENASPDKSDIVPKPIFNSFKKFLTKFSPKEQMEMSLITLLGMIIMLSITTVYLAFFQETLTTFFRVLIVINGLCGIGFLFSMLLTTYGQYMALITMGGAQDMMEGIKALGDLVT